jgi:AAHS family 4-hydroxybenzoate transporter-like MFS transporter
LPVFAAVVPESVRFLALQGRREQAGRILARINPQCRWNGIMAARDPGERRSVARLFSQGRALGTLLFWLALFMSLLLTVFLVSWLPLVARASGINIKSAVLAVSALNLGGIAGCFLIGRLSRRFGPILPIALAYGFGAVSVAAIGVAGRSGTAFLVASLVAGMFAVGAQMSTIGLAASFYDTSTRATGVGWALGSGRVGAVVGPVIGGVFIGWGMSTSSLFLIAGLVSLVAALAVVSVGPAFRRIADFKGLNAPIRSSKRQSRSLP